MAPSYPIRPVTQDEFPAFSAVLDHAFNSTRPSGPEQEHHLPVFEFDRSLAAFDGTQIVGTASAYTFQISVPGGTAAAAGVACVSVLPTYRRRGILTSLMRRQLADIRDRGEPLATLFASEGGIYGRFGYAAATTEAQFAIRRGEGTFSAAGRALPGGAALRLRLADPQDAAGEAAQVYESVRQIRPGLVARDDRWWGLTLSDPEHRRSGGPRRCLIAEDDSGPRGYALYWAAQHDHPWAGSDVLRVQELMAADPAACAALWQDLLTRDLINEVTAPARPEDDPLPYLLADSRRARPRVSDGLWVRLISVPEALSRRRYACGVDVVIDVSDELLTANAGRWRLRAPGPADPAGVTCERTAAPPDVALPVASLGAAYLGGTRLGALAGAGLAIELRPGSLAELSAALSWDPAPWAPNHF
jgi:predicted acetyltransferase